MFKFDGGNLEIWEISGPSMASVSPSGSHVPLCCLDRVRGCPRKHRQRGSSRRAGEFYQVAGQVVELPPEIALAAVDFNRSVLAADEDILL